jgi:hypothetical protein
MGVVKVVRHGLSLRVAVSRLVQRSCRSPCRRHGLYGQGALNLLDQGVSVAAPLIWCAHDRVDRQPKARLDPVCGVAQVAPVRRANEEYIDIVRWRTGGAVVALGPGTERSGPVRHRGMSNSSASTTSGEAELERSSPFALDWKPLGNRISGLATSGKSYAALWQRLAIGQREPSRV